MELDLTTNKPTQWCSDVCIENETVKTKSSSASERRGRCWTVSDYNIPSAVLDRLRLQNTLFKIQKVMTGNVT